MHSHLPHTLPWLASLTPEQKILAVATLGSLGVMGLTNSAFLSGTREMARGLFRFRRGPGIRLGRDWISDEERLRHTHIVGATGTGKTVLLEHLIFADLLRGYGAVIIDPKGERSFYESVKAYCHKIGRGNDLHFLSASFPEESVIWNPCGLGNPSELQTKFFNSAIYDEPHYAKACEYGLIQAFRKLCCEGNNNFTIRDLIRELESISKESRDETLKGLFFDLNNLVLGEWEEVIACGKDRQQDQRKELSILDIVKNNKILFVDLPTEGKKVQSSRIGRLLTQEIVLISGLRKRNPQIKGDRPFSVFIDEFDAFATESFATFLNKGRSSDFMIHLAHTTLSDLNCISDEFSGQILGNTNVRFIFRTDDPDDAERWSRFFGTKRVTKQTYRSKDGSRTGDTSNRESQEFVVPPDTIKSLKIGRCVFSVKTRGEPKVIQVPFQTPKKHDQSAGCGAAPDTTQKTDDAAVIVTKPPAAPEAASEEEPPKWDNWNQPKTEKEGTT